MPATQEIDMDIFDLLFASKYGMAAFGTVTLAAGMLVSTFVVLARKASRDQDEPVYQRGQGSIPV